MKVVRRIGLCVLAVVASLVLGVLPALAQTPATVDASEYTAVGLGVATSVKDAGPQVIAIIAIVVAGVLAFGLAVRLIRRFAK